MTAENKKTKTNKTAKFLKHLMCNTQVKRAYLFFHTRLKARIVFDPKNEALTSLIANAENPY
jgi:hypothetical protein